jgi:nucleoside-diphosphate-sugar epimerase
MKLNGVLITGGGGFLGSHLAENFLKQGASVICVDNFSTGTPKNQVLLESQWDASKFQFIKADVAKPWSSWVPQIHSKLKQDITHVLHFASPASPPHYQRLSMETMWVNSVGLKEALDFADHQKSRLVFASTSEIYGDPNVSPQPESYWGNVNTLGPRSCYDEAKRFGEALLHSHNLKNHTEHGLVRIFNTYGPRMNPADGRVIINFLVQALKNEKLTIYGEGLQTRSFCFVDDLVRGIDLYAQTSLVEPVNLGNDKEFSILQLVEEIQRLFPSVTLEKEFLPMPKDDPRQRCPDLAKANKFLGWSPECSLHDGLKKMLSWLKDENLENLKLAGRPQ